MKLSKEFIEGYCQSLIDTNEGLSNDLDVQARVYHIEVLNSYEVAINWCVKYDNFKEEEIRAYKEFKIEKLKDFGFELANLLDELCEVKFDADFDSRQDKLQELRDRKEFADEMEFESNRGN